MIKVILGFALKGTFLHICNPRMVKDGSEYFGPYTSFKTILF
jgi:hypothetical protein